MSRIAIFCKVIHVFLVVPKAPWKIEAYTWIGLSPVSSVVSTAQNIIAITIANSLIPQALCHGSCSLLEIWNRGSCFLLSISFTSYMRHVKTYLFLVSLASVENGADFAVAENEYAV